jgi:hypothetical protein
LFDFTNTNGPCTNSVVTWGVFFFFLAGRARSDPTHHEVALLYSGEVDANEHIAASDKSVVDAAWVFVPWLINSPNALGFDHHAMLVHMDHILKTHQHQHAAAEA